MTETCPVYFLVKSSTKCRLIAASVVGSWQIMKKAILENLCYFGHFGESLLFWHGKPAIVNVAETTADDLTKC